MKTYLKISLIFLSLIIINCSKDDYGSGSTYESNISQNSYTPPSTTTATATATATAVTQYTLNVSAGVGGAVSTSGGTYDDGTSVIITATADDGYEFTGWNGSDLSNSTITITLNANTTIEAIFNQISTITVGNNINFIYNLHESLPSEYITEFNTIMDNLISTFPTVQQTWLLNPNLNIYAWNNTTNSPYTDPNGNLMQGASISGNGSSFWMILEIPSDEFTNNSMHRYSVIAHEYFHVYQMSLSENFAAPSDDPNGFSILWLSEGTAASFESLYIQQYYGTNYFEEGFAWVDISQAVSNPASYESFDVGDMNYAGSTFMILALVSELKKIGFSEEKAFQSVYKTFWESNPSNTNWKTKFEEVFTISVDSFYQSLASYSPDMSLIYPSDTITIQNIINDNSIVSVDTSNTSTETTSTETTSTEITSTETTSTETTSTETTSTETTSTETTSTETTSTETTSTETTSAETASSTYNITVTAQNSSNYTLSGSDQNGNVSGNDPPISAKVGDTLSFNVNSPGHDFFIIINSNGGFISTNLPSGVSNNGTASGTVSWTPTEAGTYYYICEFHPAMIGTITITQ